MSNWSLYKDLFSKSSLEEIYSNHVVFSGATGIDKVTHNIFMKSLSNQLDIVSKKALVGKYKFSKYRLKLISKGRGNPPREISIPTIRDRIALKAICEFLNQTFSGEVSLDLPQNVVRQVKKSLSSGKYTSFIKLDVKEFYPNIIHDVLIRQLESKVSDPAILAELTASITTPTVEKTSENIPNRKGVPQGLSISNILAAIYLGKLDQKLQSRDFAYFRYVDDILIFCTKEQAELIANEVIGEFKSIGLTIYTPGSAGEK